MSQITKIKKHLESGLSITHREAQDLFQCDRLAARINDLRGAGMKIITTMIERNGKKFARYHKAVKCE